MENRIASLESFQKKWKHYFWIVCTIATIAAIFFQFKVNKIYDDLDAISSQLIEKQDTITELQSIVDRAKSNAERAYLEAGDIQYAISEAKKASQDALQASKNAITASMEATNSSAETTKALRTALTAAEQAKATSKIVEGRLRQFELLLVQIQSQLSREAKISTVASPKQQTKLEVLNVEITGANLKISFAEGNTPYKTISVTQANYQGVVYVPIGYIAQVNGTSVNSKFIISERLRGRVINNVSGFNNKWVQK